MRLVAANIQTQLFKLDEGRSLQMALGVQGMTVTEVKDSADKRDTRRFIAAPSTQSAFCRRSGLILWSPLSRRTRSLRRYETLRELQRSATARSLFRQSSEPFAFTLERPTKRRCEP